jgi:hypothetical protein
MQYWKRRLASICLGMCVSSAWQTAGNTAAYVLGDSIGEGFATASGLKGLARSGIHIRGSKPLEQIAQTPSGSTVFVLLGTNDAEGSIAHIDKSIDDIVQAGERKHFTMVWLGPHCVRKSWDTRARELDDMLRTRLAATSVRYISMRDQRICAGTFHEPDGVHLTMKCYRYMWDKVRVATGFTDGPLVATATPKRNDGSSLSGAELTTGAIAPYASASIAQTEGPTENSVASHRMVVEIHTPPAAPTAPLVWVPARK